MALNLGESGSPGNGNLRLLDHRAQDVQHALKYARDMGRDLADKFVGMYVNHWTLDYGEKGRESIRRFLGRGFEQGLIPHRQELEFVV